MRHFRRLRCLSIFIFCFAYFTSIGGQWVMLQGMAWSKMFVEYAKTTSIQVAVGKTFDGSHPCQICRRINRAKSADRKHEPLKDAKKFESLFAKDTAIGNVRFADARPRFAVPTSFSPSPWSEGPPTPPPQWVRA